MPATMLSYNTSHELISQNTYYNCGPGSSQLVLDARGIYVSEEELSVVLGTTVDGTPSIDNIAAGLNHYDPESQYAAMWMPNDPPRPDEVDLMRERIFRTIAWGRGCVANVVVPPANYPKAVPKSDPNLPNAAGQSPGYAGGVVFHYISVMASDDSDDTVMIVDPGFQPSTYWVTVTQLASMVTPHGIVWASGAPPLAAAPTTPRSDAQLLADAMGNSLPIERYQELLPAVKESLQQSMCDNELRVAMWLAQIGHESMGLYYQEEIADGSAYEGRADLGNTQPGDGPRFKGRGWIQLTGRSNYAAFSQWAFDRGLAPTATHFVDNPTEVGTDRYAGLSTSYYWTVARGSAINDAADRGDLVEATRLINGGDHGLADRQERYDRCLGIAPLRPIPPLTAPEPSPPKHAAPEPAGKEKTCLTGRPHHHSENAPTEQQVLDIRAEGLITQALVFAIAEKLGVDAHGIYDAARNSF